MWTDPEFSYFASIILTYRPLSLNTFDVLLIVDSFVFLKDIVCFFSLLGYDKKHS